jgi:hypothetical protein
VTDRLKELFSVRRTKVPLADSHAQALEAEFNNKNNYNRSNLLVGLLTLILGILLSYGSLTSFMKDREHLRWMKWSGVVYNFKILSGNKSSTTVLYYKYYIGGKERKGEDSVGGNRGIELMGLELSIWVNPNNKDESALVLDRLGLLALYTFIGLGSLLILVGGCYCTYDSLKSKYLQNKRHNSVD